MWLTLDIGNSAIKGGLFAGPSLQQTFRLPLHPETQASTWSTLLAEQSGSAEVTHVGIASVVPALTSRLQRAAEQAFGVSAVVLHHTMPLPFTLAYETPHTLGIDRLAAAAAAWVLFGRASGGATRSVVAVDAGTAVTYEVIDRTSVYRGGAIGPGPALLQRALHTGTAQLPEVPLVLPDTPIGRSTREALQAGLLFGFVDGVRGMLARLAISLGETPFVVATGGWASFLQTHVHVDVVEPHLVLHGVRVLLEQQAAGR